MRAAYRQPSAATKARKAANGGMNDTEAAFQRYMQISGYGLLKHEPVTLVLPGGAKYTPDFGYEMDGCKTIFFEVKGSKRTTPSKRYPMGNVVPVCTEAARLRIKVAAATYPQHRFILTWPTDRRMFSWMEKEYGSAAGAAGRK